ncbi:plexin domain-containing protein 1-like isoform X3 [Syngnathoides biaculeatus]|uniref:plexin domain-containing protein 1-like isoform X3 n=1 Tax=Syngnathoides biaculeatus TaxID=300417 RepID=UPI002ADE1517|nr:plexin domain-containing protein 1-like isoform X3 [Syngnathoides biaculeatus]XP_061701376.1 plexin domain-containing protein 1-like isoform X3 [Syngnathoides biaculeatus]XP_061701377.1 plexin domain-containing protein 1-like isoform X3 [Syngnathoides biaculeatus]
MMILRLAMTLLCLSQKPSAEVASTEDSYNDISEGHARTRRGIMDKGLFIDTLTNNMTSVVEDRGKYYTWRRLGPEDQRTRELWVDMSDPGHGQVRVHGILSNSYQQAAKVALSFDFPFYGHYLRQVIIATGGFIFTGELTHRMLTSTQYIAPLMANFDPSHSKESKVQYMDNGEVFVVQWERVRLVGKESAGAFTFQAALYRTGMISFSYKEIPLPPSDIGLAQAPVKVGLSDAFMVKSSQSEGVRRQTVYEYHRIEVGAVNISNSSAVEFTPLPTCLQHDNCERCISSNRTSDCSWCNVLQRCSDGMDRYRQEWLEFGCSEESKRTKCDDYPEEENSITPETYNVTLSFVSQNDCNGDDAEREIPRGSLGWANTGVLAGVASALVLILALALVALYIYCHPTVTSPLCFIHRHNSYWPSLRFCKQQQSGYPEVEGYAEEGSSMIEAGP